jgi:hypothetical protein
MRRGYRAVRDPLAGGFDFSYWLAAANDSARHMTFGWLVVHRPKGLSLKRIEVLGRRRSRAPWHD